MYDFNDQGFWLGYEKSANECRVAYLFLFYLLKLIDKRNCITDLTIQLSSIHRKWRLISESACLSRKVNIIVCEVLARVVSAIESDF